MAPIIGAKLTVFKLGLAEKVGNAPGIRRPSELGLPAARGAASSPSPLVGIAIVIGLFPLLFLPKT